MTALDVQAKEDRDSEKSRNDVGKNSGNNKKLRPKG